MRSRRRHHRERGRDVSEDVWIELRGLRVQARIGVTDAELEVERPLLIDIDLIPFSCAATETDAIEDTVDYSQVGGARGAARAGAAAPHARAARRSDRRRADRCRRVRRGRRPRRQAGAADAAEHRSGRRAGRAQRRRPRRRAVSAQAPDRPARRTRRRGDRLHRPRLQPRRPPCPPARRARGPRCRRRPGLARLPALRDGAVRRLRGPAAGLPQRRRRDRDGAVGDRATGALQAARGGPRPRLRRAAARPAAARSRRAAARRGRDRRGQPRDPAPGIGERRFVLEPLLELAPDLALPDGTPLAPMLAACRDQEVTPAGSLSDRFHSGGSAAGA